MRRLAYAALAIFCAVWQFEWAAFAAVRQTAALHADCRCQGTAACCCGSQQATVPMAAGQLCHMKRSQAAPSGDCRLLPDDCGHPVPSSGSRLHREPLLPPAVPSGPHDNRADRVIPGELRRVAAASLEPPFVPPEPLLG